MLNLAFFSYRVGRGPSKAPCRGAVQSLPKGDERVLKLKEVLRADKRALPADPKISSRRAGRGPSKPCRLKVALRTAHCA